VTMPKSSPRKGAIIELEQEDLKSDVIIHKNLTQDVLLTTEDKMKLTLIEYREVLASRAEWLGAGVLALSFLSSLLFTSFKDIGSLKASTWQAIYAIFFILSFGRFVIVVYKMYVNRKKATINYVIRRIKQSGSQEDDGED
jgi:hypothetical protein